MKSSTHQSPYLFLTKVMFIIYPPLRPPPLEEAPLLLGADDPEPIELPDDLGVEPEPILGLLEPILFDLPAGEYPLLFIEDPLLVPNLSLDLVVVLLGAILLVVAGLVVARSLVTGLAVPKFLDVAGR